jgi:hypothetical protein
VSLAKPARLGLTLCLALAWAGTVRAAELKTVPYWVHDGRIVIGTTLQGDDGVVQRISQANGLAWQLESGQAEILEDPYTGYTLVRPLGDVPVVIRPVLPVQGSQDIAGASTLVGIDPQLIPVDERGFTAAGGGACPARWLRAESGFSVIDVRAVMEFSVIPLSRTERVMRYHPQNGEYYSFDENIGPMRIRYDPDRMSEIRLVSHDPTGAKFFPASAEGRVHLIIELLGVGLRLFNPEPMVLRTASTNWPPFEIPMLSVGETRFFEVDNPDVELLQVGQQELYLYPTRELAMETRSFQIRDGVLETTIKVRNLSESPGEVRWFVAGNIGEPLTPERGRETVAGNGSFLVTFRSRPIGSTLPQSITLTAVTESGARLTGGKRIEFRYPEAAQAQAARPATMRSAAPSSEAAPGTPASPAPAPQP